MFYTTVNRSLGSILAGRSGSLDIYSAHKCIQNIAYYSSYYRIAHTLKTFSLRARVLWKILHCFFKKI